jgi:hypothetical protein
VQTGVARPTQGGYAPPRRAGRVHRAQGGKGSTTKSWKPNKVKHMMVLGGDIGLEQSCNLALCALVGRLSYRTMCRQSLLEWVSVTWDPLLGYTPEVMTLSRGWFGFIFKSPEDTLEVLGKLWVINGDNLMLKRWRVSFDPTTDYFQFQHFWVLLPWSTFTTLELPRHLQPSEMSWEFIKVDEEALKGPDKRIGKSWLK